MGWSEEESPGELCRTRLGAVTLAKQLHKNNKCKGANNSTAHSCIFLFSL